MGDVPSRRMTLGVGTTVVGTVAAVVALGLLSPASGIADDGVPAGKASATADPPGSGNDVDDSTGSSGYPVVQPVPDSASAEVNHIKNAAAFGMRTYNEMQILPPGHAERVVAAEALHQDVQQAAQRGPAAFVSEALDGGTRPDGRPASEFRKSLVKALDQGFVVSEGLEIAAQLVTDARDAQVPSLTSTEFEILAWQGVTLTSAYTADAVLLGQYTTCSQGGAFVEQQCTGDPPMQWKLKMFKNLTDKKWRIAGREGTPTDDAFEAPPTLASPEVSAR